MRMGAKRSRTKHLVLNKGGGRNNLPLVHGAGSIVWSGHLRGWNAFLGAASMLRLTTTCLAAKAGRGSSKERGWLIGHPLLAEHAALQAEEIQGMDKIDGLLPPLGTEIVTQAETICHGAST
jgi:hypothetical protein